MGAEEKWVAYQNDILKRLAWELESGEATDTISGRVVQGDYEPIQYWVLRELGYTGERLERMKEEVNFKLDFGSPEWKYLLEKYLVKVSLTVSAVEAKKKFVSTIEQAYDMKEKLGKIFNDNEKKKKEKASKQEAEKAHNKRWYK